MRGCSKACVSLWQTPLACAALLGRYLESAGGHLWLAQRIPDDSIFISANQGRLQVRVSMWRSSPILLKCHTPTCLARGMGSDHGQFEDRRSACDHAPHVCPPMRPSWVSRYIQTQCDTTQCDTTPPPAPQEANLEDEENVLHSPGLAEFAAREELWDPADGECQTCLLDEVHCSRLVAEVSMAGG